MDTPSRRLRDNGDRRPPIDARPPVVAPPSATAPAASGAEFTRRDWQALARSLHRHPELTPDQVRTLRRDIALLVKQRARWVRSTTEEIAVGPRTTVVRRTHRAGEDLKYGGRLRGVNWRTDPRSSGPCPICNRALPHTDFVQRKYHNFMVYKRRGLKQIWARMRAGTHRPWERSNANRRVAGHARRVAVFAEEAPHVTRVLGPQAIDALVWTYNTHHGYAQYRMWVRVNYGRGRKKLTRGRRPA